ncbi:MAG: hypothetical protein OER43_08570 [Gammaproteobacteria bacterium]|nr:hypothetical protein [Gammaproteobacteria bacterium]
MKTSTRYLNKRAVAAVFAAGLLAVAAGTADAQRAGPRASVASSTHCAIDDGMLVVTTTLTNKSSGLKVAEVRGGEITATTKPANQRGNATVDLASQLIGDLISLPADVDPTLSITAEFDLCDGVGGVKQAVLDSRELNGTSSVDYGLSGGNGETRNVTNRCTDDPDTLENEGGIKTADVIDDLVAACMVLTP